MTKPIIGIAGNHISDAGETLYNLAVSYIPDGYVRGVQQASGLPLVLPIDDPTQAKTYIDQIDKLILAGGQNVSPKFYHQPLQTEKDDSFLARDEFELALIEAALLQNKPIFAVCRGMQLLNVAFGGTLIQALSTDGGIRHMQAPIASNIPTHHVQTKKHSMLQKIYGEQTQVNSFHNQAVAKLSVNFEKTAWSPDEITEGIEDQERRLLAVQWHPDFACHSLKQEQDIFDYVVQEL